MYQHDPFHPIGTWNLEMGYGRINVALALVSAGGPIAREGERVSRDYALAVQILFGLRSGGAGVVLQGGQPVPVDPGWLRLTPEKRDVLLSLAITELAEGINDRETAGRLGEQAGMRSSEQRSG